MKNIKFRAWDKKSKKMRVVSCLVFDTQSHLDKPNGIRLINLWGQPFNPSEEDNPHVLIQRLPKEVELMQFTGLFDKQGLEIYEGDLVKFDSDLNTFIELEFSNKGKEAPLVIISEVVFKNGMYVFDYMFGWEGREVNFNEVEVIGNIYEHSHLLDNN